MELEQIIDVSSVFEQNQIAYQSGAKIIVNQGGTRSGKTYSICQLLIAIAQQEKVEISITSLSFPHLRKGAMKDWREIMENNNWYHQPSHVRTENKYKYQSGGYIEFFSVDDHLKVRGPGRDILFINEANLIDFDTFTQLALRTRKCIIIDYNPADEFHFIYDHILTRPDCKFIQSTYRDNPFLPAGQIKEIENLKNVDENLWRVYGEGERGHSEGIIYTHWNTFTGVSGGGVFYGLDFGFSNPSALVRVTEKDTEIYAEEILYQSHLTTSDLIGLIKELVPRSNVIYCDSAEPDRITELQRAGIMARPADKNVKDGILFLKSRKMHIHAQSVNLLKEIKSYKFIGKENKDLVPMKANDHALDAMRYAVTPLRNLTTKHSQPMFIR